MHLISREIEEIGYITNNPLLSSSLLFHLLIEDINSNGGLNNKYIIIKNIKKTDYNNLYSICNNINHIYSYNDVDIRVLNYVKQNNKQIWFSSFDTEYRCDENVFVLSPSMTQLILPIIYYFQLKNVVNIIHIGGDNNYSNYIDELIRKLDTSLDFDYRGTLIISDFNNEDILSKNIVEFINTKLYNKGIVLLSLEDDLVHSIGNKINYYNQEYDEIYFVFMFPQPLNSFYSDVFNIYASTHYIRSERKESIEFENIFYSYFGETTLHKFDELVYCSVEIFKILVSDTKTFNPTILRNNFKNLQFYSPHGLIYPGPDNHLVFPSYLLKLNSNKMENVVYKMNFTFSPTLRSHFPDELCKPIADKITVLYIECNVTENKINYFPFFSLMIKHINDNSTTDTVIVFKSINFCTIESENELYNYIRENNIGIILMSEWYIYKYI